MERKCKQCGIEKPETEFHKTSRKYETASGLEQIYQYQYKICKQCRNDKIKIWRDKK